jgi:hypothetical protein
VGGNGAVKECYSTSRHKAAVKQGVRTVWFFLSFVDRASRYNHVKENELDSELILSILSSTSTYYGRI